MYISKVESWTSPDPCGKTSQMRRGSIIPDFVKLQIQGQNVGNMVASRSKTSKQNLTVVVTAAVSVETISVGPVAKSVVATIVAAKAVAIGPVVSIGIGLRLGSGESRKGKCQDSLHLSSATFCDKPSPC